MVSRQLSRSASARSHLGCRAMRVRSKTINSRTSVTWALLLSAAWHRDSHSRRLGRKENTGPGITPKGAQGTSAKEAQDMKRDGSGIRHRSGGVLIWTRGRICWAREAPLAITRGSVNALSGFGPGRRRRSSAALQTYPGGRGLIVAEKELGRNTFLNFYEAHRVTSRNAPESTTSFCRLFYAAAIISTMTRSTHKMRARYDIYLIFIL